MATITRSSTADPTAHRWIAGNVEIELDASGKLETDDETVISFANSHPDFTVTEDAPAQAAPAASTTSSPAASTAQATAASSAPANPLTGTGN